jgi:hypothetical protein
VAGVRHAICTQRLARQAIVPTDKPAAASTRIISDHGLEQPEIAATCGVPPWTVPPAPHDVSAHHFGPVTTATERALLGKEILACRDAVLT